MTTTTNDANQLFRNVRIGVMSSMETGNFDRARTLIREYKEVDAERAASILADVVETYHISI